ncbi:MAG TPA: hypothetical protein VIY28_17820 [Pseudonocardiaceae bacterium]
MPTLPTTTDVRHARKQAEAGATATFDTVKNPLFAAIGAVDEATHVVTHAMAKARSEAAGRAEEARGRLQQTMNDLRTRVSDLPAELGELRSHLEPPALRELARSYREAAQEAYAARVERGGEVFDQLRTRPRVQWAFDSVESGVDTAQQRLEAVISELNSVVADLLTRLARTSRSVGEKVARDTDKVSTATAQQVRETGRQASQRVQATADEVSDAVTEAGDEVAHAARSASRKAANRAAPPRRVATRGPGTSQS